MAGRKADGGTPGAAVTDGVGQGKQRTAQDLGPPLAYPPGGRFAAAPSSGALLPWRVPEQRTCGVRGVWRLRLSCLSVPRPSAPQ